MGSHTISTAIFRCMHGLVNSFEQGVSPEAAKLRRDRQATREPTSYSNELLSFIKGSRDFVFFNLLVKYLAVKLIFEYRSV